MSLGITILNILHVGLSLIGIVAGLLVLFGFLTSTRLDGWTKVFLGTTIATSVTGFMYPFHKFLPSHAFGIISLIVLPIAIYARYPKRLAGGWRRTFVITSTVALYLNVLVLIAQIFDKVPALHALAPAQSEPPFLITELANLALFIVLGIFAAIKFRVEAVQPA